MDLKSVAAVLLFFASLAAAQPDMSTVTFGPGDAIVPVVLTIVAVSTFAMSHFFSFQHFGAGTLMSRAAHANVDSTLSTMHCGFFAMNGWVRGLLFFIGYALFAVSGIGYTLHIFETTAGVPTNTPNPTTTAPFASWYSYIWAFSFGAIAVNKIAINLHAESSQHLGATIVQWLSTGAFVTSVVFLILEMSNLSGSGTTIQWEIFHMITCIVWTLVSVWFAIRLSLITYYVGKSSNEEGYEEMKDR